MQTEHLREYLIKGFTLDDARLKGERVKKVIPFKRGNKKGNMAVEMKKETGKTKSDRKSLATLAEEALKKAVARVIADHRRTGDPIAVLRNGKAVSIAADQIRVSEPEVEYDTRSKKATKPRNTQTTQKKKADRKATS